MKRILLLMMMVLGCLAFAYGKGGIYGTPDPKGGEMISYYFSDSLKSLTEYKVVVLNGMTHDNSFSFYDGYNSREIRVTWKNDGSSSIQGKIEVVNQSTKERTEFAVTIRPKSSSSSPIVGSEGGDYKDIGHNCGEMKCLNYTPIRDNFTYFSGDILTLGFDDPYNNDGTPNWIYDNTFFEMISKDGKSLVLRVRDISTENEYIKTIKLKYISGNNQNLSSLTIKIKKGLKLTTAMGLAACSDGIVSDYFIDIPSDWPFKIASEKWVLDGFSNDYHDAKLLVTLDNGSVISLIPNWKVWLGSPKNKDYTYTVKNFEQISLSSASEASSRFNWSFVSGGDKCQIISKGDLGGGVGPTLAIKPILNSGESGQIVFKCTRTNACGTAVDYHTVNIEANNIEDYLSNFMISTSRFIYYPGQPFTVQLSRNPPYILSELEKLYPGSQLKWNIGNPNITLQTSDYDRENFIFSSDDGESNYYTNIKAYVNYKGKDIYLEGSTSVYISRTPPSFDIPNINTKTGHVELALLDIPNGFDVISADILGTNSLSQWQEVLGKYTIHPYGSPLRAYTVQFNYPYSYSDPKLRITINNPAILSGLGRFTFSYDLPIIPKPSMMSLPSTISFSSLFSIKVYSLYSTKPLYQEEDIDSFDIYNTNLKPGIYVQEKTDASGKVTTEMVYKMNN